MKIKEHINRKCNEIIKDLEDKDPFGVSIDDYDSTDTSCIKENEVIPPGDDGYGDEDEL